MFSARELGLWWSGCHFYVSRSVEIVPAGEYCCLVNNANRLVVPWDCDLVLRELAYKYVVAPKIRATQDTTRRLRVQLQQGSQAALGRRANERWRDAREWVSCAECLVG